MGFFDWFRPILTPQDIVRRKRDWRDALMWIRSHIDYEKVGSPFPASVEVLARGRANCKGFAVLTAEVLCLFGFSPRILCYSFTRGSEDIHHAAVFFMESGKWKRASCGDVTSVSAPPEASLVDALKSIEPTVYYAQEVDRGGGHLQTLISKI